jgi:Carboxypeptidase regulatory-like domain
MRSKSLQSLFIAIATAMTTMICLVAQAQQPSPTDEKPDEAKTGAISGRVVNDTGQPIPNASVFVRAFGLAGQGRGTTTDGEGNFQVAGLDRAAYLVSASAPAYTTAPRDPDNTQAAYYRVGDSVKLELIKGGVITGKVTTTTGDPVVAVRVRAHMIRDGNGQPSRYGTTFRDRTTDDRGVYRIYGLAPGTYIVSAGGGDNYSSFNVNAYDTDAPTYAPASTRDTAMEINVRAGEDTASIDIRYRGEPGHVVSGVANGSGDAAQPFGFTITLSSIFNGVSQSSNSIFQPSGGRGFVFNGVADGEYDVTAQSFLPGGEGAVSDPLRIKVKGGDITGIVLSTKPLGSITGRVVLEESKVPECKGKRRPLFRETLVTPWHNEKNAAKDRPQFLWSLGGPTLPDKEGYFTLRNLAPGQYRFSSRSFAKYWFLQSISLQSAVAPAAKAAPANRPVDAARNWTTVKPGDRLSGLTITLAEGAASLRGNVQLAESERVPAKLYLHLVPAEKDKAEDVLRFFATAVNSDGTFSLGNLPPGRYWALARVSDESLAQLSSKLRLPDEADTRARLRREAEAAKTEIEFKPCQNMTDYQLPLKLH